MFSAGKEGVSEMPVIHVNTNDCVSSTAVPVDDVAAYFVHRDAQQPEPDVTPLKLQKLLYYTQGQYLAATGHRLFDETIEAWDLGPVVNRVYARYADMGGQIIAASQQPITVPVMTSRVRTFLDRIWDVYARYTSSRLVTMTHSEAPWLDFHRADTKHAPIPDTALLSWFHRSVPAERVVLFDDVVLVTTDDLAELDDEPTEAELQYWRQTVDA